MTPPVVDVHVHAAPARFVRALAQVFRVAMDSGVVIVEDVAQMGGPLRLPRDFVEPALLVGRLDRMGIDIGCVSLVPMVFGYHLPPERAQVLHDEANAAMAEFVAHAPERLRWLASVPLQDAAKSVECLRLAMHQGALGVQIGSHVNGRNLDEPEIREFLEEAARLHAFVLVHSVDCLAPLRMQRHYFANIVGNPYESGLAVGSVIMGGVLDRSPGLNLCFCHGGGAAPALAARWDRAWSIDRLDGTRLEHAPSSYFRRLYFDSLVYGEAQLRLLASLCGTERILLGTDTPFPIGIPDPVRQMESIAWLGHDARSAILGRNAQKLLGLPPAERSRATP